MDYGPTDGRIKYFVRVDSSVKEARRDVRIVHCDIKIGDNQMDYGPYYAIVRDEWDGDTIGLDIDLGFKVAILTRNPITNERWFTCRLYGIDAPELSTPEGKLAREFLLSILPIGTKVRITSKSWDAYQGRYDGIVTRIGDLVSINDLMVESGHAVPKVYK